MENIQQVTISAASQLRSIYKEASGRLNQLMLGQNMFGYDPDWVPRLAYNYYADKIASHTAQLKSIEDASAKYDATFTDQNKTYDTITAGKDAANNGKIHAEARIEVLTGANRTILTCAYQIELFSPIWKEKKSKSHYYNF